MLGTGGFGVAGATQAAGTLNNVLVPPQRNKFTRITTLSYTPGTTAHTGTALRSIGRTLLTAAAAANATVLALKANPGPAGNLLQANNLVAVRETDGVTRQYKVASITGLNVTLTSGLVVGAAINADLWDFGLATDTEPQTGLAHSTIPFPASTTTTLTDRECGVFNSWGKDEPILLQSNNITAAGVWTQVSAAYTIK